MLLGLREPRVLVAGFDRPNIFLRVERVFDAAEKNERLPALVRGRRALVYAATRKSAESAAATLERAGVHAAAYHAGLEDARRTRVQDEFASGLLPVVCATNAFGMGIDRPDIEAVVHYAIPGSIEAYYQEIGRAGRDGRAATATLLWDVADVATREFLIERGRRDKADRTTASDTDADLARRRALERQKLRRMVAYADTRACLRSTILRHFGDRARPGSCGSCGNCQPNALDAHEREIVRKILAAVTECGERYGRRRIGAMLPGAPDERASALGRLASFGALRDETADAVTAWIGAALAAKFLVTSTDAYRTLSLTDRGRAFLHDHFDDASLSRPRRVAAPYEVRRRALTGEDLDDAVFCGFRPFRRRRA